MFHSRATMNGKHGRSDAKKCINISEKLLTQKLQGRSIGTWTSGVSPE